MSCFLRFTYYSEMDPHLHCLTATTRRGQPWTRDILQRELVAGGSVDSGEVSTSGSKSRSHRLALPQIALRVSGGLAKFL